MATSHEFCLNITQIILIIHDIVHMTSALESGQRAKILDTNRLPNYIDRS